MSLAECFPVETAEQEWETVGFICKNPECEHFWATEVWRWVTDFSETFDFKRRCIEFVEKYDFEFNPKLPEYHCSICQSPGEIDPDEYSGGRSEYE